MKKKPLKRLAATLVRFDKKRLKAGGYGASGIAKSDAHDMIGEIREAKSRGKKGTRVPGVTRGESALSFLRKAIKGRHSGQDTAILGPHGKDSCC